MPKTMDQCLKLIFGGELGNRRPSQLMESMLALLRPREDTGILFKTLFVTKLPSEVRTTWWQVGTSSSPGRWPR